MEGFKYQGNILFSRAQISSFACPTAKAAKYERYLVFGALLLAQYHEAANQHEGFQAHAHEFSVSSSEHIQQADFCPQVFENLWSAEKR